MRTTWPSGEVQCMGSHFSLEPRKVKVHSVFHSAMNLIDESKVLHTLVMHECQMHPSSALVCFSDSSSGFDERAFTQEEKGMFVEGKIAFDCGIWVSCLGAKRVHPSEERPPTLYHLDASFLRDQIQILSELQQGKQTALTVKALFGPETETNSISSLVSFNANLLKMSMQTADISLARQGLTGLLGLGPGLTPSGDDFICGFFLALHMCQGSLFAESHLSAMTETLSNLIRKPNALTTDISLQLLGLASEGLFSQPLLAMAKSFSSSVSDRASWEALSDFGHSSGLDAGLGFLFALSFLLPDFEYKGEVC